MMNTQYIEKIYAGWLAKIIGIRLGAPIEGWTYEQINNVYGELTGYPVDYKEFAADDDSNGPLFFLRALEDSGNGKGMTAQDVAEALLNYAPFEHGFFWWGGYGVSTEHTAYLNLSHGIQAPRSGSIAQNGCTVAEQIGGQIFIDTWGLVAPGNPDLAATLAEKAASVTHGGNGIYGGVFIAACISFAFVETDIRRIIEKGLSYIPADCEYTRVVRSVMDFYDAHPDSWRACFEYVYQNFGYDKYPGNCHIIPNTAVMILSMLYGKCDFADTLNICNMCGWDTDCNVGNIATIMGVICGLDEIDGALRKPINDFLACSSVIGSMNLMDIPYGASYIVKLAASLAGEKLPEPWDTIISRKIDSCHFEYPGSTHAMRVRYAGETHRRTLEYDITNTTEAACTGSRSLKVVANSLRPAQRICIYKKTYYKPEDFHDSRYDPSFSPLLYPGQTIHGSIMIPDYADGCMARLYARESRSGILLEGEPVTLEPGVWQTMEYRLPPLDGALVDEAGFLVDMHGMQIEPVVFTGFVDDLYFDGKAEYTIDFSKEETEVWTPIHKEISQFTRLKGLLYLEDSQLCLSCSDFAEAYTGHYNWTDYTAEFNMTPRTGEMHFVNVRVQGAIRSYAVGFAGAGKLGIYKNVNGYRKLAETDFDWKTGESYRLAVAAIGGKISVNCGGAELCFEDKENPYVTGSVGISVREGSHCRYGTVKIGLPPNS